MLELWDSQQQDNFSVPGAGFGFPFDFLSAIGHAQFY